MIKKIIGGLLVVGLLAGLGTTSYMWLKESADHGDTIDDYDTLIEVLEEGLDKEKQDNADLEEALEAMEKSYATMDKDKASSVSDLEGKLIEKEVQVDLLQSEIDGLNQTHREILRTLTTFVGPRSDDELIYEDKAVQLYYNDRYAYGLTFPKQWIPLMESTSGDGLALFNIKGYDLRVFGGARLSVPDTLALTFESDEAEGYSRESFSNKKDQEGYVLMKSQDGQTMVKYYIVDEDRYCCFYGQVDDSFYEKNADVFHKIGTNLILFDD